MQDRERAFPTAPIAAELYGVSFLGPFFSSALGTMINAAIARQRNLTKSPWLMSLHRAHSFVVDEVALTIVDDQLFKNIQGRKETLGNPTDDEIRAILKV